jgi:hypothetical protein
MSHRQNLKNAKHQALAKEVALASSQCPIGRMPMPRPSMRFQRINHRQNSSATRNKQVRTMKIACSAYFSFSAFQCFRFYAQIVHTLLAQYSPFQLYRDFSYVLAIFQSALPGKMVHGAGVEPSILQAAAQQFTPMAFKTFDG